MKIDTPYTIAFFGQTGFGKSSLINALFGTNFNNDPLVSCTKELYSVTTVDRDGRLLTVYDTPGIGEFSTNSAYQAYYDYAVSQADCIVLVVSMDRTDATAQELLEGLKQYLKNDRIKFVIALNRIDSSGVGGAGNDYVSWCNDINGPTEEAWNRIKRRLQTIKDNFDDVLLPFTIVPVCAIRNYGLNNLYKELTENE